MLPKYDTSNIAINMNKTNKITIPLTNFSFSISSLSICSSFLNMYGNNIYPFIIVNNITNIVCTSFNISLFS